MGVEGAAAELQLLLVVVLVVVNEVVVVVVVVLPVKVREVSLPQYFPLCTLTPAAEAAAAYVSQQLHAVTRMMF